MSELSLKVEIDYELLADRIAARLRGNLTAQAKQADASCENYYTLTEVCDILKVGKMTLYRWAKSGYLVPLKSGKKCLYSKTTIQTLLTPYSR